MNNSPNVPNYYWMLMLTSILWIRIKRHRYIWLPDMAMTKLPNYLSSEVLPSLKSILVVTIL